MTCASVWKLSTPGYCVIFSQGLNFLFLYKHILIHQGFPSKIGRFGGMVIARRPELPRPRRADHLAFLQLNGARTMPEGKVATAINLRRFFARLGEISEALQRRRGVLAEISACGGVA